ncbi:MAG: hypothetical protein ACLFVX_02660 [Archaeoglobaceae archaeon]
MKGEAPFTLDAYFSQQSRWTIGTTNHLKKVVLALLTKPGKLGVRQWWEYVISGTWFLVGWAYVIYFISPMVFILFGIRPVIMDLPPYLAALSSFKVTPKDGKINLPWRSLWPQMLFMGLLALTSTAGLLKLITTGRPEFLLNVVLSTYFLVMLSTIFYFNRGPIIKPSYYKPVFRPARISVRIEQC